MDPKEHPAIKLLDELLSVPSPSGREERLADIVRKHLDEMAFPHETDPAGNISVRLEGENPNAPLAVFAAHMDEIAMVVTRIDPDGRLRVTRSGGLYPYKIGEGAVEIVGDGEPITGVFSMGSTHVPDPGARSIDWKDTWIITGLSPEQLSQADVRVGSCAVPVRAGRGPFVFGDPADPMVAAWTFDDRAGVMTLLRLLEAVKSARVKPSRPLLVAFTVHEEGGCHGAKVLCHRERPEIFLAIDGCPIVPPSHPALDGRPATWSKDKKTHYDQRLIAALRRAAKKGGTELQVVVLEAAYSDASAVYDVGAAPRVAVLGHVRENSHGYEVARLSIFDNLLATLVEFIQAV